MPLTEANLGAAFARPLRWGERCCLLLYSTGISIYACRSLQSWPRQLCRSVLVAALATKDHGFNPGGGGHHSRGSLYAAVVAALLSCQLANRSGRPPQQIQTFTHRCGRGGLGSKKKPWSMFARRVCRGTAFAVELGTGHSAPPRRRSTGYGYRFAPLWTGYTSSCTAECSTRAETALRCSVQLAERKVG